MLLRSPGLLAVAATLLVALTAALLWQVSRPRSEPGEEQGQVAQAPDPPPGGAGDAGTDPWGEDVEPELLDALVVLENWELLNEIDPLDLDAITVFEPSDEALLEVANAVGEDSNG